MFLFGQKFRTFLTLIATCSLILAWRVIQQVALHLMVSAKAATVESVVLPLVNRFFAAFDSVYGLLLQNHASVRSSRFEFVNIVLHVVRSHLF